MRWKQTSSNMIMTKQATFHTQLGMKVYMKYKNKICLKNNNDNDNKIIIIIIKKQGILSALCPPTCNSTRPQHTLQMFADHYGPRQTIPWETINQGLLQPQGELNPIQTILTIAAGISSSSFVRVSTRQLAVGSLSKGISSTLNFTRAMVLTGLELATSRTQSERRIDWANLTAIIVHHYLDWQI